MHQLLSQFVLGVIGLITLLFFVFLIFIMNFEIVLQLMCSF